MRDLYIEAVQVLAEMMYAVSEPINNGQIAMMHCNDNNLNVVPDMMARLGVMTGHYMHHEFVDDWQPGNDLPIVRHRSEPQMLELHDGLEFCSLWYRSPYQLNAHQIAVANARANVEKVRDDSRIANPSFSWIVRPDFVWTGEEAVDASDLIESYWDRRRRIVECLGGKESLLYPRGSAQ